MIMFEFSLKRIHLTSRPAGRSCNYEGVVKNIPFIILLMLQTYPLYAVDYMQEEQFNIQLEMAHRGDNDAQYSVGDMYFKGRGVYVDYVEAVSWFRSSATQGNSKAEFKLGYMFLKGLGVKRDPRQAFRWMNTAAGKGYAPAQFFLGQMYVLGDGVGQSSVLALKWLTESIQDGYRPRKDELKKIRQALDRMLQKEIYSGDKK